MFKVEKDLGLIGILYEAKLWNKHYMKYMVHQMEENDSHIDIVLFIYTDVSLHTAQHLINFSFGELFV
jgi:hypothetical protein